MVIGQVGKVRYCRGTHRDKVAEKRISKIEKSALEVEAKALEIEKICAKVAIEMECLKKALKVTKERISSKKKRRWESCCKGLRHWSRSVPLKDKRSLP